MHTALRGATHCHGTTDMHVHGYLPPPPSPPPPGMCNTSTGTLTACLHYTLHYCAVIVASWPWSPAPLLAVCPRITSCLASHDRFIAAAAHVAMRQLPWLNQYTKYTAYVLMNCDSSGWQWCLGGYQMSDRRRSFGSLAWFRAQASKAAASGPALLTAIS